LPAWRSENPAPQLKVADAGRRPDAAKALGRTKARMLMAAVGDFEGGRNLSMRTAQSAIAAQIMNFTVMHQLK
jgi:hypothetical protein